MNLEIERKFLVKDDRYKGLARQQWSIEQAYLSKDPERTVRVRIANDQAWLTIKGKSDAAGLIRKEWEKEISLSEAQELMQLCLPRPIQKIRYVIPYQGLEIVVDAFSAPQAMVLAEVELPTETTPFSPPDWLGEEVTGNPAYYNSNL